MRNVLFYFSIVLFVGCNSSSSDKDPKQAMDDTARMQTAPVSSPDPNFMVVEKTDIGTLPASLRLTGIAKEAWKWNDSLGENMLVLSELAPYADKRKNENDEEGQTAEIHASHYIKKRETYENVWMLNDEVKACPFDITCQFIPGSATITDLDKDGYAEIKVQYMTACRSDVSPARMNLVIRENGNYYELRGNSWIAYSPDLKFDINESNENLEGTPRLKDEMEEMNRRMGRYESERQFTSAPPEFLVYAKKEWVKYVKEKMGE